MANQIQSLMNQALGDGARSTKFECAIVFNKGSLIHVPNEEVSFHVKTSQFPGKSNDVIDLKFKGRTIPIKGQVKYDNTWGCSFYLDEGHLLKKSFEDWIESLEQVHNMENILEDNIQKAQNDNTNYQTDMKIYQNDFHGNNTAIEYTLYNVFPKSISTVDVDYSSVGTILEYTVEFSYSHYTSKIVENENDEAVSSVSKEIEKFKERAKNQASEIKESITGLITSGVTISGSGFSNKESSENNMADKL